MDNIPWDLVIYASAAILIVLIMRDPLSRLLRNAKFVKYKNKTHSFHVETRDVVTDSGAEIKRSESESIVTAKDLDKSAEKTECYSPDDSYLFYQNIANYYDRANSEYIWETHRRIVSELVECLTEKNASVIDLGGGTGRYIAVDAVNQGKSYIDEWTNLDFSENMHQVFIGHMNAAGVPHKTIKCDLAKIRTHQFPKKYDAAILSFVLSSLVNLPSFEDIRKILNVGAHLIIAEGDPIYTLKKGCIWSVKTGVARKDFSLNPVNPAEIIVRARENGFEFEDIKLVKKFIQSSNTVVDYSYVLTLKAI